MPRFYSVAYRALQWFYRVVRFVTLRPMFSQLNGEIIRFDCPCGKHRITLNMSFTPKKGRSFVTSCNPETLSISPVVETSCGQRFEVISGSVIDRPA